MKHPLGKFHRSRPAAGLRDSARSQAPASAAGWHAACRITNVCRRPVRQVAAGSPPWKGRASSAGETAARLRWYQYSLRTLFVLTLIVSLLMSWHATKMKRATAQKNAVEAILAAGGTVEYDYQFDEQGISIKGATGRRPAWLRDLLGPDYFDTVAHVTVKSAEGMAGVNGLARLRSLSIYGREDDEDPMSLLRELEGLEELNVSARVSAEGFEHIGRLKHLRRLTLELPESASEPMPESRLAALRSCPALHELSLGAGDLSVGELRQIEALSQLEKLTLCNISPMSHPLVFHIKQLTALRELRLSNLHDVGNVLEDSPLIVGDIGAVYNLTRLETLTLPNSDLCSSNVESLCTLPALRELDVSGCTKINDRAVPYFQKMGSLRRLNLAGTGMTQKERSESMMPYPIAR